MRAYLEITTFCNKNCSFCVGTERKKEFLSPSLFEERLKKVLPVTENIYLHVMGEPLLHPDFQEIASLCRKYNAKLTLVTNGSLLKGKEDPLLENPALYQINFSLHGIRLGSPEDEKDLENILLFCQRAAKERKDLYINLRLWNQKSKEEKEIKKLNTFLLSKIGEKFPLPPERSLQFSPGRKSKHLTGRIYLNMDTFFQWPETEKELIKARGFCHGLRDQFGVLCDGTLVPCCLDTEGKVSLGNIHEEKSLQELLASPLAEKIRKGFEKGVAEHPFCQKCSFRTRFQK